MTKTCRGHLETSPPLNLHRIREGTNSQESLLYTARLLYRVRLLYTTGLLCRARLLYRARLQSRARLEATSSSSSTSSAQGLRFRFPSPGCGLGWTRLQLPVGNITSDWILSTADAFFARALRDSQHVSDPSPART